MMGGILRVFSLAGTMGLSKLIALATPTDSIEGSTDLAFRRTWRSV